MDFTDILIEPVVTEKANELRDQNKYVFIVHLQNNQCYGQNEAASRQAGTHKLIQKGNRTSCFWTDNPGV